MMAIWFSENGPAFSCDQNRGGSVPTPDPSLVRAQHSQTPQEHSPNPSKNLRPSTPSLSGKIWLCQLRSCDCPLERAEPGSRC